MKKYKDEGGLSVGVQRSREENGWVVSWDGTLCLGELIYPKTELSRTARETRIADAAAMPLATSITPDGMFIFRTKALATKAMRLANEALLGDSTLLYPQWAVIALHNGWKPPKGWEP